jgi:predicted flap endonuclease-1-like 5' DNA nuclease
MPYTLAMMALWLVLATLLGIVVGWLLRNVTARRQIARVRSQRSDIAELERLRGRVANLESVVAERDRLVAELEACQASGAPTDTSGSQDPVQRPTVAATGTTGVAPTTSSPTAGSSVPSAPDLGEAAAVLGRPVQLDDLTVVEGIGPMVEEMCHGIGIRTWFDLANTEVSLLRTMLADAGARFKMHDPSTWPQQAALLAHGRWSEFDDLARTVRDGSREVAVDETADPS